MGSVLYVERSAFFQKIIRDLLRPRGYQVLHATGVTEALELWEREKPELVITAMELDDGKGPDLIRALNAAGSRTPVVVISASEDLKMRQDLFDLGVADYLIKQDIKSDHLLAYLDRMAKPDPGLRSLQNLRIAVLDDSKFEIQVILSIFALHGIKNVVWTTDPQEFARDIPAADLYVIDLVLPGVSGEEIVAAVRRKHSRAMIVVASSVSHAKTVARVLAAGADDYISKPFEAELFMARIKATHRLYDVMDNLREKQGHLENLSRTDGLTGVLNHRAIMDHLEAKVQEHKGPGPLPLGLLLLDVDHFKQVNDQLGHLAGDAALVHLCRTLEGVLPPEACLGRYGGEEFLILVPGLAPERIRDLADTCIKKVAASPLELEDRIMNLSFSGGLVIHPLVAKPSQLVHLADSALYEAKRQGRGRVIEIAAD